MRRRLSNQITILIVISTILMVVFVALSFTSYFMKKPIKIMGYGYGIVETNSMYPMIVPGDFVLIQEQDDYEIGDVIAFTSVYGITIVHEVIDKTLLGFETKGINNNVSDLEKEGYIELARVQGKVVNYGGHELGFIIVDNRSTLIGVSVLVILVVFIIQIVGLVKQLMEKQKLKLQEDLEKTKQTLKKEIEQELENKNKQD